MAMIIQLSNSKPLSTSPTIDQSWDKAIPGITADMASLGYSLMLLVKLNRVNCDLSPTKAAVIVFGFRSSSGIADKSILSRLNTFLPLLYTQSVLIG